MMALVIFVGFQNCSKVNFAATDGSLVGKTGGLGDGLEDVDFPEDEVVDPVTNIDEVEGACEAFAADADAIGIERQNVVIRKHRGALSIADSQSLELSNIRGAVQAKTAEAGHLRNMRGDLCLVGNIESATLDQLNNHRGHIEIIGIYSKVLNNTRGTLIINGGSVDLINNHRGNIILKNGATVGEIRNLKDGTISDTSMLASSN